jgi:hypothetical protein
MMLKDCVFFQQQRFGSGSELDPDSIRSVDPDPESGSGSGSRRAQRPKKEKSKEISCFEVLDVLFRGLKVSPVAWTSFMEALG